MKKQNIIPAPLLRKIILTPLLGSVCMILGIAMFWGTKDRTLLILSGVLLAMCAYKGFRYYQTAVTGRYETVCGTCIRIAPQIIGKLRKIYLMDDAGVETVLRLPKQQRFTIGSRYRFYFAKVSGLAVGGEYLDALFSTGAFLGYEQLEIEETEAIKKEDKAPKT